MMSNLELACTVFWGTYESPEDCTLLGGCGASDPESACILKDTYFKLSEDAQLMVKTIAKLPDEMFYENGRIILRELNSWMFRRYGWSIKRVNLCRDELRQALGSVI